MHHVPMQPQLVVVCDDHSDPRMSNARLVVEVDGVASLPSSKVVPTSVEPDIGECSRLVLLTPVRVLDAHVCVSDPEAR